MASFYFILKLNTIMLMLSDFTVLKNLKLIPKEIGTWVYFNRNIWYKISYISYTDRNKQIEKLQCLQSVSSALDLLFNGNLEHCKIVQCCTKRKKINRF